MRKVRAERGLTAKAVAQKAKMRPAMMTHLEQGGNAAWGYYSAAARAMGYRSALELFMSGGDRMTAQLLRAWRALPDDEARMAALELVRRMNDDDAAP